MTSTTLRAQLFCSIPPSAVQDTPAHDVSAVLTLADDNEDSYAGPHRVIPPFASLHRKSLRCTVPFATIRRVEHLNASAGMASASYVLTRSWLVLQIIQLTPLGPTAGAFCAHLRNALKLELQKGQMKTVKAFVKTCYSEALISTSSNIADNERKDGSLVSEDEASAAAGTHPYHGGLGLRF